MMPRREILAFGLTLAALLAGSLRESLLGGKVLSPADVVFASASFRPDGAADYEPANRLLMDPVLQFQPWLEFNRACLRRGRLPLWNPLAGCGAPHLANGQSAVFDPFHAIAYLGRLPWAHAPMAFARLWVAGLGMFLLAKSWGLRPWGRWFAGLAFPLSGFLACWLLFPVASTAVWLPWLLRATDPVLDRPGGRSIGGLALVVGLVLLGGHIQTGAHVLMAAGLYACWRCRADRPSRVRTLPAWAAGVALGVGVGAVAVVPLGCYLSRSPVWADRAAEARPPWVLARPRLLDAVCTALPYAYGSQRRGHPNLARALGVHNLNESAGGFAGLATVAWLAPVALSARRRCRRVGFLAALVAVGAMGAFALPPVENLLRALPVLRVTDHRRLTLWVAFGLAMLGGIGLDHLGAGRRGRAPARAAGSWIAAAAVLLAASLLLGRSGDGLRARALAHYDRAAARTPGADPSAYRARAERQVQQALSFLPRYWSSAAGQLLLLATTALALRRGALRLRTARAIAMGLALLDLLAFGRGLNPAIDPAEDRPTSPLVAYLRREVAPPVRAIGLGAELPPNMLMRYGLADARNYDSVELSRGLAWLAPLYEPSGPARTSRREITWAGVRRAADRLRVARVGAVVAATPPPPGAFDRVDRVGSVWVARLPVDPPVSTASGRPAVLVRPDAGAFEVRLGEAPPRPDVIFISETFDPGWRAEADGRAVPVGSHRGTFLAVPVPAGVRQVVLRYDPPEIRAALATSAGSLLVALMLASGAIRPAARPRKKSQSAWKPGNGRVTIDPMTSAGRISEPASH